MTDVRTFKAATMQQALELVRQEMGGEAVILHTRQISGRRILPWRKPNTEVEITAGTGVNIRPPAARQRSTPPNPVQTPGGVSLQAAPGMRSPARPTQFPHEQSATDETSEPDVSLALSPAATKLRPTNRFSTEGNASRELPPGTQLAPAIALKAAEHGSTVSLEKKLDSIQQMLEKLGRAGELGRADEIPSELFHLYTELIDAEVENELARDLVFRLRRKAGPDELKDTAAARLLLTAMVESEIQCAPPITPARSRRKVVALVGPTGVGKTTTIAKLAANFRLREGVKMGLVTVDTYRIAAVEQLRTYAEIIDLPMKVVTNPLEMRRALDELTGLDLVLIDTAGRSPRDELKIQELKSLLSEAQVDEVHLVLSMTSSLRSLQATAEKFAAANTTSMILTKLDEAAGPGTLISVSRKVPLPISYLTTGQDVPDDIEPANPSRIARLVLGQDRLFD
jgi:flagellar biosynthesis protein FlhF